MVGSDIAASMTGGLDRLLRPARHPMLQLLIDAPLTAEDILGVDPLDTEHPHVEPEVASSDVAPSERDESDTPVSDFMQGLAAGLDRLRRRERHPMMLILGEAPLTVEDILAVPQSEAARLADRPAGDDPAEG